MVLCIISILQYIQQDAKLHSLYLETALHVSGGTSSVELHFEKKNVCVPRSFRVINFRNKGRPLCLPSIVVPTFCIHSTNRVIVDSK
jgi:hypothetical protein